MASDPAPMALRPASKCGIVLAGIAVAWGAAWIAMEIRQRLTDTADARASPGMYAFGDLILGVMVFAVIAMFPLAFALYWLRPVPRFWGILDWIASLYAATGPFAIVISGWLRTVPPLLLLATDARIGEMPLSIVVWAACAAFAPAPRERRALAVSAGLDAVVFASMILFDFVIPALRC